jgi:hypothetical protein
LRYGCGRRNRRPANRGSLRLAVDVGLDLRREHHRGLAYFLERKSLSGVVGVVNRLSARASGRR